MKIRVERRGFTLLEVLLAASISVLLLAALYVAVDIQLRHAEDGRAVVAQSTLARALIARITADIAQSLPPQLPAPTAGSSSSGTGAGGGTGTGSGAAGSSTASSSTASSASSMNSGSATSSSASGSSSSGSTSGAVPFNTGIQGDNTHLSLSMSRLPREALAPASDTSISQTSVGLSDLRRITYWLAGSGDSPLGLARQEYKQATSDDSLNAPSNVPDDPGLVIAPEVKQLEIQYFDGSNWQDSWDGTQAGADGTTPMGPPVAIAVTLGIAPDAESKSFKVFRQVILIATANGTPQASTTTTTQ
jgi:prepilin-type N-terminal cleavage/methylation domain-containing protein